MQRIRQIGAYACAVASFVLPAYAANWTTFAGTAQRLGSNASEFVLSPTAVPGLKLHWKAQIGGLSHTQPLYVEQVATANGTHDEVFVTTGAGHVEAFNALTGAIDWTVAFPLSTPSCPGASGLGVYGTPTINVAANLIYVVDGGGALHALDLRAGVEAGGYPVQVIDPQEVANGSFNHSSPTLLSSGDLLITTSGVGPCEAARAAYHGQVLSFNLATRAVTWRFTTVGGRPSLSGGGIWGPGGAVAESDLSSFYIATGNSYPMAHGAPYTLRVVQLDKQLNVLASNRPPLPMQGDLDFGSTPTLIDARGCPPLLAVLNKSGMLFVYNRQTIASGPVQQLQISSGGGTSAFIGMAAYDARKKMLFVNNPIASLDGNYTHGAIALKLGSTCQLSSAWQASFGSGLYSAFSRATDPVVADGVVWVATGNGSQLAAFAERSGASLWNSGTTIPEDTITSPMVADGQAFVIGGSRLYAFGL